MGILELILNGEIAISFMLLNNIIPFIPICLRTKRKNPKVSMIHKSDKDLYINFNYTATLENVYGISDASVIHIHGSLRGYTWGMAI